MNRDDLSIELAIPLWQRVLCEQKSYFEPIGLTGGYSCSPFLLMSLRLKNHRYKVFPLYELTCHKVSLLCELTFLLMVHIKCYIG